MFLVKVLWSVNETNNFYTHPKSSIAGLRSATQDLVGFHGKSPQLPPKDDRPFEGILDTPTRPNPFHFQLSPFQSLALWAMKSVIVLKLP